MSPSQQAAYQHGLLDGRAQVRYILPPYPPGSPEAEAHSAGYEAGSRGAAEPTPAQPEPAPAQDFEIARYAGTWYEVARLPRSFERGCGQATAVYTLRADGRLDVLNVCPRADGSQRIARGVGRVVGPRRLKVSFVWPFEGDYHVLALDPGYSWSMVGDPRRKTLWILSRTPRLPWPILGSLLEEARRLGYTEQQIERLEIFA